jgi:hypothetical protein
VHAQLRLQADYLVVQEAAVLEIIPHHQLGEPVHLDKVLLAATILLAQITAAAAVVVLLLSVLTEHHLQAVLVVLVHPIAYLALP